IVEKRIIPKLTVITSKYANELMTEFQTLDKNNNDLLEKVYSRVYTDLISQTIRQLIDFQYDRKK
ncbi:MAG TPA: hypothetical protein VLB84_17305, partial [Bacteroidia bacterium]|nr:hypothetical protein [Bacteroidia bacterium]